MNTSVFFVPGEIVKNRENRLVVLNRAPPDLVHRVLRDGKLVLDRSPSKRIRFEVKARNEFFDLLPILRQYRRVPGTKKRMTNRVDLVHFMIHY